jgi:hypothetical protein
MLFGEAGKNYKLIIMQYSETSIHRFCRRPEKETMDLGKQ